jgi:hypothetical protein
MCYVYASRTVWFWCPQHMNCNTCSRLAPELFRSPCFSSNFTTSLEPEHESQNSRFMCHSQNDKGWLEADYLCPPQDDVFQLNPLKPRERQRWEGHMESRFKEEIKGWSERHFIFRGERKSIILLEGSQATSARPSGRKNVKVKSL